jgi:hypothetical protein
MPEGIHKHSRLVLQLTPMLNAYVAARMQRRSVCALKVQHMLTSTSNYQHSMVATSANELSSTIRSSGRNQLATFFSLHT